MLHKPRLEPTSNAPFQSSVASPYIKKYVSPHATESQFFTNSSLFGVENLQTKGSLGSNLKDQNSLLQERPKPSVVFVFSLSNQKAGEDTTDVY